MPGFNQKGPKGEGPMTGRKLGRCTNFGAGKKSSAEQTEQNTPMMGGGMGRGQRKGPGQGQGLGLGRGRCGMGRRNRG